MLNDELVRNNENQSVEFYVYLYIFDWYFHRCQQDIQYLENFMQKNKHLALETESFFSICYFSSYCCSILLNLS